LTIIPALFKPRLPKTPFKWQFPGSGWSETGMLALLTSKWRLRAGAILVALYALCLVAPVAAFAFSDGSMLAHCLGDEPHSMAMAKDHSHHDGVGHQPAKSGHDDRGYPDKCCGLFCVTAIAPPMDVFNVQQVRFMHLASLPTESLTGLGFDRIDRPPRSFLSL
jgi:hypothetical protein